MLLLAGLALAVVLCLLHPEAAGWQVGAPGYPVLSVDYNEYEGELLYAAVGPWQVKVGDRVCVRDADGIASWAYVRGPWLGGGDDPKFVGVEVSMSLSAREWDELNPEPAE